MAGMPPIRCFNCNYDHGRFRTALLQIQKYTRMNPSEKTLLYDAFNEFKMCEMCRVQFTTCYVEFDRHLAQKGALPHEYANIRNKSSFGADGLVGIAKDFTPQKK